MFFKVSKTHHKTVFNRDRRYSRKDLVSVFIPPSLYSSLTPLFSLVCIFYVVTFLAWIFYILYMFVLLWLSIKFCERPPTTMLDELVSFFLFSSLFFFVSYCRRSNVSQFCSEWKGVVINSDHTSCSDASMINVSFINCRTNVLVNDLLWFECTFLLSYYRTFDRSPSLICHNTDCIVLQLIYCNIPRVPIITKLKRCISQLKGTDFF